MSNTIGFPFPQPQEIKQEQVAPDSYNSKQDVPKDPKQLKTYNTIIAIINQSGNLFLNQERIPFVKILNNQNVQYYPINSKEFRSILGQALKAKCRMLPDKYTIDNLIYNLEFECDLSDVIEEVFLRVGHKNDKIYLDMGDEKRRVIEIAATGWNVTSASPVAFLRPRTMQPIAYPQKSLPLGS